jgi:hypothetical protein
MSLMEMKYKFWPIFIVNRRLLVKLMANPFAFWVAIQYFLKH